MQDIRELLASNTETAPWLERLESLGSPDCAIVLPTADELPSVLLTLAVPHEDINDLVALLPSRERSPDIWWLLERCAAGLVRTMGAVDGSTPFLALPPAIGALHRYFYVYVLLAALPRVQAFHRARGIPDDVSRLTLADLGRNMAVHRQLRGTGGLDGAWLRLHFQGALYDLGRLQFQRGKLGNRTGLAITAAGLPYGPGDPTLAVHVPEFYGPLTPPACDASFVRAVQFFARHFPEETYDLAFCHSWLLDDQLGEYLPEDSNIIRFQRRFRHAYTPEANDDGIIRFVFGRLKPALDDLPQRTTLERAIVDHLKTGRHWHGGAGWLRL